VDFLLVLIELIARCYCWGEWISVQNWRFSPMGPAWPKISGRRGCPHQPFFLSQN